MRRLFRDPYFPSRIISQHAPSRTFLNHAAGKHGHRKKAAEENQEKLFHNTSQRTASFYDQNEHWNSCYTYQIMPRY